MSVTRDRQRYCLKIGGSIRITTGAAFLTLMMIGLLSTWLIISAVQAQWHEALIINLAGRQRMLSQKMVKEIALALLKVLKEGDLKHRPASQSGGRPKVEPLRSKSCGIECHTTAYQFEQGLKALMEGGKVKYAGKTVFVPPADPSQSFHASLKEVKPAWEKFIRVALAAMEGGRKGSAFPRRLSEMGALSTIVLEKVDKAVRLRQEEAETKRNVLVWLQLLFLFTGGLALATSYWLVLKYVLKPVQALTTAVQAMEQGDFEAPVNVRVGNELGLLANAFDATRKRIKTYIKRLETLNDVTHAINQRLDILDIVRVAIEKLEGFLPDTALAIFIYDAEADEFVLGGYNAASEPIATLTGMTVGDRVPAKRFRLLDELKRGGCVKVDDLAQTDICGARQYLLEAGFRSVIMDAIMSGGELMGVIHIGRRAPEAFSQEDQAFLSILCDHLAVALHNAKLFANLQRAYEDLKQAQAMLVQQERLRVLGQMASGIVHDVNNSLVPIIAYMDILENHPDAEVREWVRQSMRAVDDLTHIINRLKVFYRRQTSQDEMELVNLNELVEQVVELTRPRWFDQAQREGVTIDLVTDLDETMPSISGVGAEIRESLVNLVFNAVDAIVHKVKISRQKEEGKRHKAGEYGKITVRTRRKDNWAVLEVQDNGIGMDEETKYRCLEPFFTTKGELGSGLGLAMVYGIMQRHGGDIEIESELGKGSTFRLLFPLRTVERKEEAVGWEGTVPPLQVLLIDDDPRVRAAIAELLHRLGHKATEADGGEDGLAKFKAELDVGKPFDLVITDLGMPKVTGEEVVQSVKALSPMTPVIVITGWGEGSQPAIADAGLSKPVRLHDLRRAIAQLWQQSSLQCPH